MRPRSEIPAATRASFFRENHSRGLCFGLSIPGKNRTSTPSGEKRGESRTWYFAGVAVAEALPAFMSQICNASTLFFGALDRKNERKERKKERAAKIPGRRCSPCCRRRPSSSFWRSAAGVTRRSSGENTSHTHTHTCPGESFWPFYRERGRHHHFLRPTPAGRRIPNGRPRAREHSRLHLGRRRSFNGTHFKSLDSKENNLR